MADVLVLENVYKSFGKRMVIDNVSLSVKEGEVFGFLGPNGAGKTTTIKMILGLLSIDSGRITIMGHDIEKGFEKAMKYISGIVENPDMYGYLSGHDNLLIHARACGAPRERIDEVVRIVGMQKRIKDKFKSYSLGMKQRIGVAQALLHNPKIMILDEPTNGLDPAGIKEVRDLLKYLAHTEGISVFVSSHILKEMQEMCDTVCIINNGRILRTGRVDELTHDAARGLYRYRLRPMDKAVALLRENAADRISEIGEDYVDLHVSEDEIEILNRRLVENGITIYGMSPVETSLEQIFMEITGGGNVVD
ncbi:MAG TPA: ABC transporter ATP-binding protein [Candidatus Avimonas sp.]|jgi:ABC-2 type transport system ATP-binding protein|nr:ABC transporter ATP-binding protein [Clostridiales bacterium]HOB36009.1 ABC transporter ATP-binding protein [Candidatus Avimonas sp.]HQA15545.1 ABC transporter ATP-binding protein [Candidatus Avimonas sp.]HQD37575.1 ABC transporter ATP-binding protein [Candidatus Avimonas sp.]